MTDVDTCRHFWDYSEKVAANPHRLGWHCGFCGAEK